MSQDQQRDLLPNEQDILRALGDRPYDIDSMEAIANIYRAAAAIRRRAEARILAELGLSWGGFTALWVLYIWGQMETSRLATECDLSKGTLTGILNTLESRGFVSRERPKEDRRKMLVELTPEGTAVIGDLSPRFNAFESETTSVLDVDEKRQLASLLRTIIGGIADSE
ncbi:MarR family winged helix-turn-helix transcriptional regulator [Ilumatobacter sp.]|uniref:MarR family winged helix-turn-helix transcriptional regulator n=1 Tax=Ilumatobacter sp. TaxID=1967498 RepID=UPI003C5698B4